MNHISLLAILALLISVNCMDQLGPMNVYRDKITLSGFSSGGTFAQQLQFAYSSLFSGIAVFSHTFYRCGPPDGLVDSYDRVCTKLANLTEDRLYDPNLVHRDIQDYHKRGWIEDPANLRNKKLYVYTGIRNALFSPRQSLSILTVYERYLGSLQNVFSRVQDANLVMPTDSRTFGSPCTEISERNFFIGQCGFSGVTEALNFLLFDHGHRSSSEAFTRHNTPRGKVSTFSQTEFTRGLTRHNLDPVGFYYVPNRCKSGKNYYDGRCYLHFYFHGCLCGREFANTTHVENTGLLELADRMGIIVVFPQAMSSLPQNEIGCFDTYGLAGPNYATQNGDQIRAVKRMIDAILGRRPTSTGTSLSSGSSSSSQSSVKWPSSQSNYGYGKNQASYYNRNNGYRLSSSSRNRNSRYLPFLDLPVNF